MNRAFMQALTALVDGLSGSRENAAAPSRTTLEGNPRVQIQSDGPGGTVRFESDATRFGMWWEFAGSDALALIDIPSSATWEATTKLPLAQRDATLRFIGEQVVAQQTKGRGSFRYDDKTMTIFA